MKRFGSIFPFLEAGRHERRVGRLVANHDFVKALLLHGDFDEFVFSNPSVANLQVFREFVESWGLPPGRMDQVRYVTYLELPDLLRATDFQVFHLGGWSRMLAGLHYLRSRHAPLAWPITAVTHSLHGRDVIDHAVTLCHARLAPHDAIFCTSRDGRDAMRRLLEGGGAIAGRGFAGELVHLPLGINDRLLEPRGDRERGRRRLEIPPAAVVLLVLGRMTPTEKMDLGPLCRLLESRVTPAAPVPLVLLVAGGASVRDLYTVKGQVTLHGLDESVRLAPNFADDEKPDILAASDILLSPVDNTQETFGLSLLEGMAAGLPVIASRFDGYKDLVDDGTDGFLVDTWWSPHDPMAEWFDLMDHDVEQLFQGQSVALDMEQMADRILTLVSDRDRRRAMGRAGRAKVDATYRWSRVIPRYEREWARLRALADGSARPVPEENPYALGPTRVFEGYASRRLEPGTRLRATGIVADEAPYTEVAMLLTPEVLARIVDAAADGATVAELVDASRAPESHAWFAVQWLMKYGLLRLEESAG